VLTKTGDICTDPDLHLPCPVAVGNFKTGGSFAIPSGWVPCSWAGGLRAHTRARKHTHTHSLAHTAAASLSLSLSLCVCVVPTCARCCNLTWHPVRSIPSGDYDVQVNANSGSNALFCIKFTMKMGEAM
jgi:hypothetical protein